MISSSSVFLIVSTPLDATTETNLSFLADSIAFSAHGSIPSPLYTNTLAELKDLISSAFNSKSCGSVPSGIIVATSTLSPPTACTNSVMALKLVTTFTLLFVVLLLLF